MLNVAEARARVLEGLAPLPAETVGLAEAWGRVLAAPVAARLTQPPADMSAMDGYAVRAADGAAARQVIGEAAAGRPFGGTIGAGQALRVFTGSVVAAGADAVVVQEDAAREGDTLRVPAPRAGQHIRPAGQDFQAGEVLLHPGTRLGARAIGLAAAANHPFLAVHRRPLVAILCTGDELALPGETVVAGGVVSSNGPMLAALVRAAGGEPVLLPGVADSTAAIAEAAAGGAAMADMLVTTGGASVGTHDLVRPGLAAAGMTLDFQRVAMRPGKPVLGGRLGRTRVLGLPGNPVSAYVSALLFLCPAIRRLGGRDVESPTSLARLDANLPANDHRADHLRAALRTDAAGTLVATPFARQDSGQLRALAAADGLILRPPHADAAAAGDMVPVLCLRDAD